MLVFAKPNLSKIYNVIISALTVLIHKVNFLLFFVESLNDIEFEVVDT